MKAGSIIVFFLLVLTNSQLTAQMNCATTSYSREKMRNNLYLADNIKSIERFTQQIIENQTASRIESSVIKIPVVVHILYHSRSEKVNDAAVAAQLEILNKCFRRLNVDAANTPERFKPFAADCEIEFQLATSDPLKRYPSGIVRKYTPVTKWTMDDKMKFSAEMGDDAWDTKSYLNIWVCNMEKFAGYSSVLGGPENVDGNVMGLAAFTESGNKTIVHEAGHWLGLSISGVMNTAVMMEWKIPPNKPAIQQVVLQTSELPAGTDQMGICTATIWILPTMPVLIFSQKDRKQG